MQDKKPDNKISDKTGIGVAGDPQEQSTHSGLFDQEEQGGGPPDLEPVDPGHPDQRTLDMIDAVNQVMPFGKFKGSLLLDLPEPYVVWFKQRGFPKGKLGQQMALIYEIKLNGMEKVFRPLVGSIEKTGEKTVTQRRTVIDQSGDDTE